MNEAKTYGVLGYLLVVLPLCTIVLLTAGAKWMMEPSSISIALGVICYALAVLHAIIVLRRAIPYLWKKATR